MPRGNRRTPTRAGRLSRWQRFLDACSEEERADAMQLQTVLRAGYFAHCAERGVHHQFGVDSAAELVIALVDWSQHYHRTCQVRKGVQK